MQPFSTATTINPMIFVDYWVLWSFSPNIFGVVGIRFPTNLILFWVTALWKLGILDGGFSYGNPWLRVSILFEVN